MCAVTASLSSETAPARTGDALLATLHRLREALGRGDLAAFEAGRRTAAAALASMPRRPEQDAVSQLAAALVRDAAARRQPDVRADAEDLAQARSHAARGWPGVLAATLLAPAWQWPEAPSLESLPEWLWGSYATWLFATPRLWVEPGQAAAFAMAARPRLDELGRWVARNRGSAAVRAALDACLRQFSPAPLAVAGIDPKPLAESYGRLLTLAARPQRDPLAPAAYVRAGRALRVGFVMRDLAAENEVRRLLPLFQELPPERFQVLVFAQASAGGALEAHCRQAAACEFLPEDSGEQVAQLRAAGLDVLVFAGDLNRAADDFVRLALHRIAPLQAATTASAVTTGLAEIDLHVSGGQAASPADAAAFTERLGLQAGPAHAFNTGAAVVESEYGWTRAALSLPDDALVFASASSLLRLTRETRAVWAAVLKAAPGSRLLLHPGGAPADPAAVERLCAVFDRELAAEGLEGDRLVVSNAPLPSHGDIRALLAVADVYLDSIPGDVDALALALQAGLPVVTLEGARPQDRAGAALLRAAGLEAGIAAGADAYVALAGRLAASPGERQAMRTAVGETMSRLPLFADALAASDAFGDMLELAYDELAREGAESFRAKREALAPSGGIDRDEALRAARDALAVFDPDSAAGHARAALRAAPADVEARHLLAKALLAGGQAKRACACLYAAVQTADAPGAELWFDLARAFRETGQGEHALQALETSLRLDTSQLDAWIMLLEIADQCGAPDIAREAYAAARHLAPDDHRLLSFAGTIG